MSYLKSGGKVEGFIIVSPWKTSLSYDAIKELIVSTESSGRENFWEYDGEFFMLFYNRFKNTL